MSSGFPSGLVVVLIWGAICAVVYVIPSVVAFRKSHPNRWIIFAINMAFGATVIGWIGALVWSMQAVHLSNQPGGSNGGESGLNLFVNDVQQVRIVADAPAPIPTYAAPEAPIDIREAVVELDRLKVLRQDGNLTQQQFDALRDVLLRRVV
ncbi:superinfection immunity protein [Rhodopseudomonas sp. P2A-2r]|uniref:superinfection immunity protein n=1 Tax=Rhodopseudomonas sp. P2A-2r TaxID=2991972 RepID=UPI002234C7C3|nr:superinfection immunity protein [Rhodopseudomonas sp. P2A-2r]UZE49812.1 superinfection immunity protein [Rhodopseudomonas sp. P2A-2r]